MPIRGFNLPVRCLQKYRNFQASKSVWTEKGCWVDNVMIERFWCSLKYEEVYLKAYKSVNDARVSIRKYIEFYNAERKHQSLDKTPDQGKFKPIV